MSPFSDQTETSLTVQAGEAAVMEVQALESQPKPAVTWEAEDGSPLYGHKYALGPDNQLVILSVSETDQKLYRYLSQQLAVSFRTFFPSSSSFDCLQITPSRVFPLDSFFVFKRTFPFY